MKRASLNTLLRISRHELDEKRRHIADIMRDVEAIDAMQSELDQRLIAEQVVAKSAGLPGDYASYSLKIRQQKHQLDGEMAEVTERLQEAQEAAMDVYRDVKKYEKLEAALIEEEKRQALYRENAQLDEISSQKSARQAAGIL